MEHLAPDVIEVWIVDADHCPDIGEEALAVVDTAVRGHPGKVSDIFILWTLHSLNFT